MTVDAHTQISPCDAALDVPGIEYSFTPLSNLGEFEKDAVIGFSCLIPQILSE